MKKLEDYDKLPTCVCDMAPMGDNGLEGFNEDEHYKYERLEQDKDGKPYYRVYHMDLKFDRKGYVSEAGKRILEESISYETCGVGTFKKYFEPIKVLQDIAEQAAEIVHLAYWWDDIIPESIEYHYQPCDPLWLDDAEEFLRVSFKTKGTANYPIYAHHIRIRPCLDIDSFIILYDRNIKFDVSHLGTTCNQMAIQKKFIEWEIQPTYPYPIKKHKT